MCINTTINIKLILLGKLAKVSSTFSISINNIIILIILKTLHKSKINAQMFTSIKYQKKDIPSNWHTFHISLNSGVYESALDLRKILKKTVSLIIAEGIEEFLEEIIREIQKTKNTADNYQADYLITIKKHEEIHYFTIFWGIPLIKDLKNQIT